MTPIKQTILGSKGNCFDACIASILDLEINDVPNLNAHLENGLWVSVLNKWLASFGLSYMAVTIPFSDIDLYFENKDFYHIIIGHTDRSSPLLHAVVGRKGKMVFDPHPTGLGLMVDKTLMVGIFVHTGLKEAKEREGE